MRGRRRVRPLVVVGAGRVGLTAAIALSEAGRPVTVRGRAAERPPLLRDRPEIGWRGSDFGGDGPGGAGTGSGEGAADPDPDRDPDPDTLPDLLFTVPDDALPSAVRACAGRLARGGRASGEPGAGPVPTPPAGEVGSGPPVALHTSGVRPSEALAPLTEHGYAIGAWHPLTALSAPRPDAFRGITFGIEGSEAARARAESWTRDVGGRPLPVLPGERARYHAAAVFASNALAACLSVAAEELSEATGGEGGLDPLLPLARAALEELADRGLPVGITGPVARGDVGTVARHLEALDPERRRLYRAFARELLGRVGTEISGETRAELRELLEGRERE